MLNGEIITMDLNRNAFQVKKINRILVNNKKEKLDYAI
jgi:hypothetical protein